MTSACEQLCGGARRSCGQRHAQPKALQLVIPDDGGAAVSRGCVHYPHGHPARPHTTGRDLAHPTEPQRAERSGILFDRFVVRQVVDQEALIEMTQHRRRHDNPITVVETEEGLEQHRLVPEHRPVLAEQPHLGR